MFRLGLLALFPVLVAVLPQRPSPEDPGSDPRDGVMYMLVTDRFDNGNPANDARNGAPARSDPDGIHGGDIAGIERRLPYLKRLGVNAVWLTPVMQNVPSSYHGYWIQDFRRVDPRLGTLGDLRRLIAKAHRLGMRVYLDVVCNHTGPMLRPAGGSTAWSDSGYALAWTSALRPLPAVFRNTGWYHNHGDVPQWRDPYQILGDLPGGLDDLRTELPEVRRALFDIYRWWMQQTGCDGFRVDTVKHVEKDFWYAFIAEMKRFAAALGRKDFFIFGEVYAYDDPTCAAYTHADSSGRQGFDAVLNFSLAGSLRCVYAQDSSVTFLARSLANLALYAAPARTALLTFVDNHDIPRFLHAAAGDTAMLRQALLFVFASEGLPVVYYGTEQGFLGGSSDGENREDMFDGSWKGRNPAGSSFREDAPLFSYIRSLAALRTGSAVLRRGTTRVVACSERAGLLVVQRSHAGERAFLVVNRSRDAVPLALPADTPLMEWSAARRHDAVDGEVPFQAPPRSTTLLLEER